MALFLNTNAITDNNTNLDLASLITMNTANAEDNCTLSGSEQAVECDYFCNHANYFTCDILYLCGNGYATIRCVNGDYN